MATDDIKVAPDSGEEDSLTSVDESDEDPDISKSPAAPVLAVGKPVETSTELSKEDSDVRDNLSTPSSLRLHPPPAVDPIQAMSHSVVSRPATVSRTPDDSYRSDEVLVATTETDSEISHSRIHVSPILTGTVPSGSGTSKESTALTENISITLDSRKDQQATTVQSPTVIATQTIPEGSESLRSPDLTHQSAEVNIEGLEPTLQIAEDRSEKIVFRDSPTASPSRIEEGILEVEPDGSSTKDFDFQKSERPEIISDEELGGEGSEHATTSGIVDIKHASITSTDTQLSVTDYADNPLVLDMSDSSLDSEGRKSNVQVPTTVDTIEERQAKTAMAPTGRWWQYGYHIKGPKSKVFDIATPSAEDPYQQFTFQDPASERAAYPEVSQSGRLRVGEGNDITPSATLLKTLGGKIATITAKIESLSHSSERKQKMMLSSRLSRVRKRANHEANKIIFAGITAEREALVSALTKLKSLVESDTASTSSVRLTDHYRRLTSELPQSVAGQRAEYVDSILEKPEIDEMEESDE